MRLLLPCLALAFPAAAQTWSHDFQESFHNFTQDVRVLPSGNVAVVRGIGIADYHLTLLDPTGAVLWDRRWTGTIGDLAVSTAGRIAVVGQADGASQFAVLDEAGNVVFQRTGTSQLPGAENYLYGAAPTADGGWVLTGGHLVDPDHFHTLVQRFDAAGALLWDRQLEFPQSKDLPGIDPVELPDRSILVAGRSDTNPVLFRFDEDGALLSKDGYALGKARYTQVSVAPGHDRVYLVSGGSYRASILHFEGSRATVLAFHLDGTLEWVRGIVGPNTNLAQDVVATPDGGALLVGSTFSFGSADRDLWMVRYDRFGELLWQHTYGAPGADMAESVDVHPGGGFVVVGNRKDDNGWAQGFVMRVDGDGLLDGCSPFPTFGVPSSYPPFPFTPGGVLAPHADTVADGTYLSVSTTAVQASPCFEDPVGAPYCSPATPNSTGMPAELVANGSTLILENDLAIIGTQLPAHQFGYFVTGMGSGVSNPPGSQGALCLNGQTIYRFVDQVQSSSTGRTIGVHLDLTQIPGNGPVLPGQTWNFQLWYRDLDPGPTSNFSDALAIQFL